MKINLANIQRFCVSDGNGIRTTVFLKGCSIRCPWCANPENLEPSTSFLFQEAKCLKANGRCFLNGKCPVIFDKRNFCEEDYKKCFAGAVAKVGEMCEPAQLLDLILKDKNYFGDNGGVTFSGGEPLLQIDALEPLIKKLKEHKVNVAVESCLYVSEKQLEKACDVIDNFIVDMKILDENYSKQILGVSSKKYISNLKTLFEKVDKTKILIRIPLNYEHTATKENLGLIKDLLTELGVNEVEIFSVHNLAEKKYLSLNKVFNKFQIVSDDDLSKIKKYLESPVTKVKIIKI